MRRIFTKRFFDLSVRDKAAIVDSEIRDLENTVGFYDARDPRRACVRRQLATLRRKAIKFGVYQ